MSFDFKAARALLERNDLARLFIEHLGWDRPGRDLELDYNAQTLRLKAVAQKRGLVVLLCPPPDGQSLPAYAERRKIEAAVRKFIYEHVIIFTNADHSQQIWQWVRREAGRPSAGREFNYRRGQDNQALLQRLQAIAFDFAEEDSLTIIDAAKRVRAAFDLEKVTKRFYERFKSEHNAFMQLVQGIPDEAMQRWYVSVTLNRVMFVYFIQKKNFLDRDPDYLRTHLAQSEQQAPDRFYRDFLCPLFFDGFARPAAERSAETRRLLGQVPYLNGGIFQRHQVEQLYGQRLDIPDAAFARLFAFFDEYRWHLDERPLRTDNEINPDVLGYIFEKYINQKQMGAYYTKEDITEYIARSTILPYIFEQAARQHKALFEGPQAVWGLLAEDPDRYIFPALRHGCELDLPADIAVGIEAVAARGAWNRPAPPEYALPTETWREVVARRTRCAQVRHSLAAGELRQVNDLISFNLDIRQFAQDVIESLPTPDSLRAFVKALSAVKVLDPTVGSGAFLFAALNILEPLYEAVFARMETFLAELDAGVDSSDGRKLSDFRQALAQMARHASRRYFVLKAIMLHNLYGVDIMDEAVEVCKLRLFLKLAAQIERVEDIEPLPDIDFNIRAGNTLIGFANKSEVSHALTEAPVENKQGRLPGMQQVTQMRLLSAEDTRALSVIEEKAGDVARLYRRFQQQQSDLGGSVTPGDKAELHRRLRVLEDELNRLLARQYAVEPADLPAYQAWLDSHKPFHWWVEFYEIMQAGGFDVIIGNPPYVEYSKVRDQYQIQNYLTQDCGNLYAYIVERCIKLLHQKSFSGVIIPISSLATARMGKLQDLYKKFSSTIWVSSYGIRPSKLFEGAEQRLSICINTIGQNSAPVVFTTKYHRWYSNERPSLLQKIVYQNVSSLATQFGFPKVSSGTEIGILKKMPKNHLSKYFDEKSNNILYWHRIPGYFIKSVDFIPYFSSDRDGVKKSEDYKTFGVKLDGDKGIILSVLNSSLFYWFWFSISEGYHCGKHEVLGFPINLDNISEATKTNLVLASEQLMESLKSNSYNRKRVQKTTSVEYQEFYPSRSKSIIDHIDQALAAHYGFTDEEVDFIINYDIKYRLGQSSEDDEPGD